MAKLRKTWILAIYVKHTFFCEHKLASTFFGPQTNPGFSPFWSAFQTVIFFCCPWGSILHVLHTQICCTRTQSWGTHICGVAMKHGFSNHRAIHLCCGSCTSIAGVGWGYVGWPMGAPTQKLWFSPFNGSLGAYFRGPDCRIAESTWFLTSEGSFLWVGIRMGLSAQPSLTRTSCQ